MRIRTGLLLVALVSLLAACTPHPRPVPEAPLGSSGSVAPPPGCVQLRKQGGSC